MIRQLDGKKVSESAVVMSQLMGPPIQILLERSCGDIMKY
jgi:hypothetical protein